MATIIPMFTHQHYPILEIDSDFMVLSSKFLILCLELRSSTFCYCSNGLGGVIGTVIRKVSVQGKP